MSDALRDHPERWPPDYQEYIFLGRVLDRFSDDDVWTALCSGELKAHPYCVGCVDFDPDPEPFSPQVFTINGRRDALFSHCQVWVRDEDTRRSVRVRRRIAVPHWLYVTRASLDQFTKSMPTATVAAEKRAAAHLKTLLERNRDMSKGEARKACERFNLSGAGFDDRVWPDAREAAGLSRQAPAGKKRRRAAEIEQTVDQIIGPDKKSGRKSSR
jgi:hypothetical protein